jgi:PRTRC genetic system protein C
LNADTLTDDDQEVLMRVEQMSRTFFYNGLRLPDPDWRLTPEQVRDFYGSVYPEITTASIEGPEAVGGTLKFKFTRALGTKG